MKTTIKLIAVCAVLFTSCNKDIEFCVDGDMNPAKPGSYTYTWCGTGADEVSWSGPGGGGIFPGESVTFNFDQKSNYFITVFGENRKKQLSEQYTINVGVYEARIEPTNCSTGDKLDYVTGNGIIKSYLYSDVNDLQMDLRNNNKTNCLDSISLEQTQYYNGTLDNNSFAYAGGFQNIASGSYLVYVQEEEPLASAHFNNLLNIIVNGGSSNLNVSNGDWDDVCIPALSPTGEQFLKTFISKTYLLTDVIVNGTSTTVSACNADDNVIFNLDGSWVYDVGADNCSGNQTTSNGTYTGWGSCSDPENSTIAMTATSGTLSSASSIYVDYISPNQLKVTIYEGSNIIIQTFTAQ